MKAVGIDIGTAFIASARYNKDNIAAKYVRDGFFVMPYLPQRKHMLQESKVPFIIKDRPNCPGKQDIYVIGNEAFDMAVLFGQELRRPLASGVISAKEKDTEFILKEIIRRVAGQAEQGDVAYYSVPANPVDANFNNIYHSEMFKRFLTDMGYNATPLNEGLAVVWSELEGEYELTGIGQSWGAGLVNVTMAYRGMEIFSFSIHTGGDYIDQQVAQSMGISISDGTAEKESVDLDLLNPKSDVQEAIQIFYKSMVNNTLATMAEHLDRHRRDIKLKDPLKIVVAGGTTMPKGFLQILAAGIKENPMPFPVGKLWQAKNPVMAVCRGCLKAASSLLQDTEYDGVKDISGGDNKKHAYPRAAKEETKQEQIEKKELTPKDLRDNIQKSSIVQNIGGIAEAIDLSLDK
jgi:actin-like ATPase involved in cell morphogenesis